MKNIKTIMELAHKMVKVFIENDNRIDYRAQLGLCISYLFELIGARKDKEAVAKMERENKDIRHSLRGSNLSNKKYDGECELSADNFKLWENYGKVRMYFTRFVDGIELGQSFITIR